MCNEREQLIAYLYDELDASGRRAMDAHLETCAACSDELRAFRSVRQDLLAWDVPPHESVWKPFVTTRPTPMWRQAAWWQLAAAAAVILAVGGVGGVTTGLYLQRAAAPQAAAQHAVAPSAPVQTMTPTTPAPDAAQAQLISEIHQLQDRLNAIERGVQTSSSGAQRASTTSAADNEALLAQVRQLITESEARGYQLTNKRLVGVVQELNHQRTVERATLEQMINEAQAQTNGNLLRVMNTRSPEKDKE